MPPHPIRVGLVVPSFRRDPGTAIAAARAAEAIGLDGVFVFDHLFPMGEPDRPAISCFPLLGALAAATTSVALGPLVARVGLVPDAVLVNQFATLARMAPGRVIAALGTGDSKSRPEHDAFGLAFPPADVRVAAMRSCAAELVARGLEVWTSGRSAEAQAVAAPLGVSHNLWAVSPQAVADASARFTVTWGGPPPAADAIAAHVAALEAAGAAWAVYAPRRAARWPETVELVGGAVRARR